MIPESKFGRWGLFGTAVYLVIISVLIFVFWDSFRQLDPNSWGDFLAGTFGPLALGWLVLGFFQQGNELRNSVKTLELQAEELRNSVEQQRELVAVSREAIDFDQAKNAREREEREQSIIPKFDLTFETVSSNTGFVKHLTLTNVGGTARSLRVEIKNLGSFDRPHMANGDAWILQTQSSMAMPHSLMKAEIFCRDQDGRPHNITLGVPFF